MYDACKSYLASILYVCHFNANGRMRHCWQVDNLRKHVKACGLAKKIELVITSPLLRYSKYIATIATLQIKLMSFLRFQCSLWNAQCMFHGLKSLLFIEAWQRLLRHARLTIFFNWSTHVSIREAVHLLNILLVIVGHGDVVDFSCPWN